MILLMARFSSIVFAVIALVLLCSSLLTVEANDGGFTVDLIHRDSPKSPLYNPSGGHYELMKRAYQRSSKRKDIFASTGIIPNDGEYLMEISFGTPPFKTYAIADSGSNLAWTQCKPCTHCFKEKFPLFDPRNSSSFKILPCIAETCKIFYGYCKVTDQNVTKHTCLYDMLYGDGSSTHGDLATETITFGSEGETTTFLDFVFGCGRENNGSFPEKSSGIVGLGFGEQSIISQLDSSINGKFSYCLGPFIEESKSGKLSFGKKSVVSGHGVVSTPLILNYYYYLILEGVTVGSKRLTYNYTSPLHHKPLKGNMIIDSGTTASYLPNKLYKELESTMRNVFKSYKIVQDPMGFFTLCFESLDDADIPVITFHFKGADLELNSSNTFVETSKTIKCLCFASSGSSSIPIFGNIAQNNLWVGYDLQNKVLSFKHSDCTKH